MSNVTIRVENLSKQYKIGVIKQRYDTLQDKITAGLKSIFRFDGRGPTLGTQQLGSTDTFWALKDVSFEVKRGEVLGIIGRNGAGKSTLLKILSRITDPTKGRVEIHGRVGSLLEVGTGFHGELTGRENTYMNGAILGMKKAEIDRKFDEIVAFAEVETFIDTPVKHYSSGMYLRLAFAVAAHLEPEILIVDEVLAVGDTVFQKKCIDKISQVSKQDRTILFVTHNLSALRALCPRTIVLREGKPVFDGHTHDAIPYYQPHLTLSGKAINLSAQTRTVGAQDLVFHSIVFHTNPLQFAQPLRFSIYLQSRHTGMTFPELDFGIRIEDKDGNYLIHCSNRFINVNLKHTSDSQEYVVEIENILKPNIYYVTLFLRTKETIQDRLEDVVSFEVADGNPYGYYNTSQIQGAILPHFTFSNGVPDESLACRPR